MTALDRYIAVTLFKSWILVAMVLLAIFGLLQFVQELEHVGRRYTTLNAAQFVLRTLPQIGLDLAPVAGLLGTLIALANLARHSELIAMRASGLSSKRLYLSVLIPATLLAMIILSAAEYVAPVLYQQAEGQRAIIQSGRSSLLQGKGLWSNNGMRYFNVRDLKHGQIPTGIDYYEFTPEGKLLMFAHADHANLDHNQNREWSLIDVRKKTLVNDTLKTQSLKELDMGPFWSKSELPVLSLSTSAMSVLSLYRYTKHLKATNQKSDRIALAFWQKLTLPLSTLAMICLAVPIGATVSTQRTSDFARRLAAGAVIGILFYLVNQLFHSSGAIIGASPPLLVFIPILLIFGATVFLYRRMN